MTASTPETRAAEAAERRRKARRRVALASLIGLVVLGLGAWTWVMLHGPKTLRGHVLLDTRVSIRGLSGLTPFAMQSDTKAYMPEGDTYYCLYFQDDPELVNCDRAPSGEGTVIMSGLRRVPISTQVEYLARGQSVPHTGASPGDAARLREAMLEAARLAGESRGEIGGDPDPDLERAYVEARFAYWCASVSREYHGKPIKILRLDRFECLAR